MIQKLFFIFMLSLVLSSCKNKVETSQEKPVVRVFDKYLYVSNLADVIPSNISKNDSTILANDYIDKWIRKQLLVRKAEMNLTEEEKNVDEQLENYRTSLLIFKYEQSLIKLKLDTVVNMDEIEKYYNDNPANFMLSDNIVKAVFLKVPRDVPKYYELRRLCRSDSDEDLKKLEEYAFKYADIYNYYNDDWVNFSEIEKELPYKLNNVQGILKYRKNLELKDTTYYYLVNLKDFRLAGTVAPLSYRMQDIRTIIMNKRKIQLINRLESNIYSDALNKGYFTLY